MINKRPSSSYNNCPIPRKKEIAKKHDLIGNLINDELLLREWSQFCEKLECPLQDKLRWERGINNGNFSFFEVFTEMLNNWIERNSNKMTVDDLCRILKDIQCVNVAEKLESEFETDEIIQQSAKKSSVEKSVLMEKKDIQWPLKHGLFVPTKNFTGREEQLEEIQTNFSSKHNLMLITGIGGIGKTELCRKFAYDILTSCIWLHGENYEALSDSVLKLSNELGITNKSDISESLQFIASFVLENNTRFLLVIDNLDVIYPEVLKIIQIVKMAKYEKMFVIVTSRDSNVLQGAGITMQLDVLSKSNARSILQNSMSSLSNSDADELGKLVQYFPLALQQALAYIKQQRQHFRTPNYSVSDYVREFEMKTSQMLGHKLNKFEHNYSMTTLVTWDITFCKMSKNSVEILKIIGYLDPDWIWLDFLEEVCTQMGVVDFDVGLNALKNYCLVKIHENKISVHRLVQEVIRGEVDNYPKTLFDSVFLVCLKFEDDYAYFDYDDFKHLNSLLQFAWAWGFTMPEIHRFHDALFFPLELNRIDCAEKVTKLKYPHIEFSSEFGVEKREFLEKVLLWSVVCPDSKTNSKEIAKGEFDVNWEHVENMFFAETLKGTFQMSLKSSGETSKITFALKNLIMRELNEQEEFDKVLELCEELACFPFEKDDIAQVNFFYKTILDMLTSLDKELENCTPSRLASLEKIMNRFDNYKDSKEWLRLEALWCDLKGDYKKALEIFTKIVQEGDTSYECKIIELKIKLTDFDRTTVEEFVGEFGEVDFEKHRFVDFTSRGLEQMLAIYERILGETHKLTIDLKLEVADRLSYRKEDQCIKLCEQVLRSQFDGKYDRTFKILCRARYIDYNYDEQRKVLENLLECKEREANHSNTTVILELLRKAKTRVEKRLHNLKEYMHKHLT